MIATRSPSVIIPYAGPIDYGNGSTALQDVFLYLRPETNGIAVESCLLSVIQESRSYSNTIELAYLANLPGDFISQNQVVEQHYAAKVAFTHGGKRLFTPGMRRAFEEYFHVSFNDARIVGAFDALELLDTGGEELFRTWVPSEDMLIVNGQSVKRINDIFVVNYDIPAILHRNNSGTDIAVMIFRTSLFHDELLGLVQAMEKRLTDRGVLLDSSRASRAFHFSKGPFEQILDAVGYLYHADGSHIPYEDISFCRFLINLGHSLPVVFGALRHPIMRFPMGDEEVVEASILNFTAGDTFSEAHGKLASAKCQYLV